MGGRINIEADDIAQLLDELRIAGELEMLRPVGLEAMGAPDAMHGTHTDAVGFAIVVAVQWVASTGGSVRVNATTCLTISGPSGGIRAGLVLSRSGRPRRPA